MLYPAGGLLALTVKLVRGQLVVPTCLIAAEAGDHTHRWRCTNIGPGRLLDRGGIALGA